MKLDILKQGPSKKGGEKEEGRKEEEELEGRWGAERGERWSSCIISEGRRWKRRGEKEEE